MHWIDWTLVAAPLLIVLAIGLLTQRYMRGVADFLSARRLAGRYLLAVARGELAAGAVVFVALFELTAKAGFTVNFWGLLQTPVMLLVALFGFVVYRYRETRAMTLAQFFEIRYGRRFRIFAGCLGFVAGVLNFGIIPAVGSRFLTYILGLPPELHVLGHALPTYVPLMALFLSVSTFIALTGGLVTVMVTDCVEGLISQVLYLVIIGGLIATFSWSQVTDVIGARPPGHSMLNPFDSSANADFNVWYVVVQIVLATYGTLAWQNASAYNAAARTPHEARISQILSRWRDMGKICVATLLAIAAITYLHHPAFAAASASARDAIAGVADPRVREQMTIPIALTHLLPVGVKGALCAVLLMGIFGGDSTHLHSWSGVLVQDVILPLRRRAMTPAAHIRLLRCAIVGVACFAFAFGTLFQQTEYVIMWFSVTVAIYVSGAGAAIIGGLYWSRGTAAGAWAAVCCGLTLSLGGIVARQILGNRFPLNGQQISISSAAIASTVYIAVSLATCRRPFDMDRMLHRGRYTLARTPEPPMHQPAPDAAPDAALAAPPLDGVAPPRRWSLGRLIGFDAEYTRVDRWLTGGYFGYTLFWVAVVIVASVMQSFAPWSPRAWSRYWLFAGVGLPVFLAAVTAVWFTWGGVRDMRDLFARLRATRANPDDDGTVVDHHNVGETVAPPSTPVAAARLPSD